MTKSTSNVNGHHTTTLTESGLCKIDITQYLNEEPLTTIQVFNQLLTPAELKKLDNMIFDANSIVELRLSK